MVLAVIGPGAVAAILLAAGIPLSRLWGSYKAGKREKKALDLQTWLQDLATVAQKEGSERTRRQTKNQIRENLLELQTMRATQQQEQFNQQLLQGQLALRQQTTQEMLGMAQSAAGGVPVGPEQISQMPMSALLR